MVLCKGVVGLLVQEEEQPDGDIVFSSLPIEAHSVFCVCLIVVVSVCVLRGGGGGGGRKVRVEERVMGEGREDERQDRKE